MPKSQVRKKKVYTPPTDVRPSSTAASRKPSPVWLPVTAVVRRGADTRAAGECV